MLLPFMTKLIPPVGISCLKSFLVKYGYDVKTVDVNLEEEFEELYNDYFDTLREFVPDDKRGNFYSIGHDVLRNHMTAHLKYKEIRKEEKKGEIELVKILIYQTFFSDVEDRQIQELIYIVDEFYNRFEKYFINKITEENPAVLGLSVFSDTLPLSLFAFKLTKAKSPLVKTVMGGGVFADMLAPGSPNLEIFLKETNSYIDKLIIGEGENLFLKFLLGELPEHQRVYTKEDIACQVLDLSTVDIPDFSDFKVRYYPYIATYTSRSCPYQCSFCAETVNWGVYRKKSAKQCVKEFLRLYKEHSTQLFLIADSLLNPIITELSSEFIQHEISLYWDGYLRVGKEVCDIENTMLWRKGGFYRARLGVESGSPHILKEMGKKINPEQIKEAATCLALTGIKTTTYWIIGYPGETEADFQQSLNLVEELKDSIYEAECKPFYYFLTGQVKSGYWQDEFEHSPVYPEWIREKLIFQTYVLNCEPNREETYRRVSRFINHCKKLDIPNPYSLSEIYRADERWKKLQKNAVPSLLEFKDPRNYIDENRRITQRRFVDNARDDVDFSF